MSHPHLASVELDSPLLSPWTHSSLRRLLAAGGRGGAHRAGGNKSSGPNGFGGMSGLEFVLFIMGVALSVVCCVTLIFAWCRSRRIRLGYVPKPTKSGKHGKAKRKVQPRRDDLPQPTQDTDSEDEGVPLGDLAQPKVKVMGPPRPHLYPGIGVQHQDHPRESGHPIASPRQLKIGVDADSEFEKLQQLRASGPRPIAVGGEPPSHNDAVDEFQKMQRLRKFTPGESSATGRKASPPAGAVRKTSPPPGGAGMRQPSPPAGAVRTASPRPSSMRQHSPRPGAPSAYTTTSPDEQCGRCLAVDTTACACCPAGAPSELY